MAVGRVEDAERAAAERIRELETRLVYANRSIDAWREHAEHHARAPAVAPPVESYDVRPRPLPTANRYTDPYAPEQKRSRYDYDNREAGAYPPAYDPRHPLSGEADPRTTPAPIISAASSAPRNPYADEHYASGSRYERS